MTCLVTLFDRKLQVFKNSLKWTIFEITFVHSKCKRSSLRSQCWMRLFLWFSTLYCDAMYEQNIYRNLGKLCSFKQDSNCDWQASNTSFLSWFPRNPANKRQKLNYMTFLENRICEPWWWKRDRFFLLRLLKSQLIAKKYNP